MWLLFVRRQRSGDEPNPPNKVLGKFASASLAARKMMEIEGITGVTIGLTAVFFPDFEDDDVALSHYAYDTPTLRYAIRKNDPKPRKDVS